jgi:hypothetical protein
MVTILMFSCKFEISMRGICCAKTVKVAFSLPSAGWTVPEEYYWIETVIG